MVVGLGAFGVITRVTLDIQPSYRMRQDAFEGLPWGAVLDNFDAVMGAGTSVSLFTTWSGATVDRLWIKTRLDDGAPDSAPTPPAGAALAEIPFVGDTADSFRRLTPFGVAGPWQDRLPHSRLETPLNLQSQSEYMLPRHRAAEAISLLRAIGPRIDRELVLTEIRTMKADAAWLSPAYGVDSAGLHFSWHLRDAAAVAEITKEIEGMLLPLGGRPHWGKVVHAPAARLAPLYPRMSEFRALVGNYDPDGKFRNEFLDRHVLGSV
jgi:xylitol oxidase